MRVKVGFVGMPNVTATFILHETDKEVQNMTRQNYEKVAFAIVRRKMDMVGVFPIHVSQPEWWDRMPSKADALAEQHIKKSGVPVEVRRNKKVAA